MKLTFEANSTGARLVRFAPLLVGGILRIVSLIMNARYPHGDVNVDASVAASLARGLGFWIPWEEGTVLYTDPIGDGAAWGHPSDSHGPLWSLLGAPLAFFLKDGYRALCVLSWIFGAGSILLIERVFSRFLEGDAGRRAGRHAAWACAFSLLLVDYSGGGSLYSGQAFGILLLAYAAPIFTKKAGAFLLGALLGALYLLSYQAAILIPIFSIAAIAAFGFRAAIINLIFSGAGCLAATAPWFYRNYQLFGDPAFTTNPAFFGAKVGRVWVDFHTNPRPLIVTDYLPESVWVSMWNWSKVNSAFVVGALATALPVLAWFAVGGFERLLKSKKNGRLRFDALLLIGSFVMLLITAVICPQPKTRHFAPILPILAGAAALELAGGARLFYLLGAALLSGGCLYWIDIDRGEYYHPTMYEWIAISPTLLLGLFILNSRTRALLPAAAIISFIFYGGARALVAGNAELLTKVYGPMPTAGPVPFAPIYTFYDSVNEPWTEGMEIARRREAEAGVAALEKAGCNHLIGEATFAPLWKGKFVSSRGRSELEYLPRIIDFYNCDAVLIPRRFKEKNEGLSKWLEERKAAAVFEGETLHAYKIPRGEKK